MKRTSFLYVLSVPTLFCLFAGCSSITGDSEVSPVLDDSSFASGVMDEASVANVQPNQDPGGVLQDQRKKVILRNDRVGLLVDKFVNDGKALLDQNKLEEAYTCFAHALELAPANEQARDLFNQVGSLLGKRGETIHDISSEARDRMVVRRAQNRIKAEDLVNHANVMMDQSDYVAAIRDLEDALLIVRWNPYLDQAELSESAILGSLELARSKEKARDLERQTELQNRILKKQREKELEEQNYLSNLIDRLRKDANNAFLNDHYKHCELCLKELLKLDPDNAEATTLLNLAAQARHEKTKEGTRALYKREWRKTFDNIDFDDLPVTELYSFPSDTEWEKVSRRGRTELGRKDTAVSPEDENVQRKLLSTPIPIQFEQTTLEEMVEYFKATTGVNFLISQEAGEIFSRIRSTRTSLAITSGASSSSSSISS